LASLRETRSLGAVPDFQSITITSTSTASLSTNHLILFASWHLCVRLDPWGIPRASLRFALGYLIVPRWGGYEKARTQFLQLRKPLKYRFFNPNLSGVGPLSLLEIDPFHVIRLAL
jgi:hypothetical protein